MLGNIISPNKQEIQQPPRPIEPTMRFENGGKKKMAYKDWYKLLPKEKQSTQSYNLERAYELASQNEVDAFASNPEAHLRSFYMNEDGVGEFVKKADHDTIGKELDFYYGDSPESNQFRENYVLDTRGDYYKYLPRNNKNLMPRVMEMGGMLTPIEAGGSHSENGLGGVPIGNNASVEQGETMTEDFVYSDKLKINKTLAKEFSLPKSTIGKTFAQASKSLTIDQEDVISQRGNERMLNRIAEAQEAYKQSFGDKYYQNAAQQNNELPVAQYGLDMRQLNMPSQPVFNPLDPMGFDRTANLNLNLQVPNLTGTENIQTPEQSAVTPESDVASDTSLSTASFSPLRYAPLAADVYSLATAERPTPMDASRYQQFGTFTENLVDRSQMRKGVMDTASTTANYLREASGGNAALFNAMMQSGSTGTQRTMGELSMQADIQDAQERARVEGLKNRQQAMNTQIQQQIDIQNQQDLAAYNNMIQDSVVNLAQNIGNIGTEQTRISQVNQLFGYDVHGQYKQAKKDGATDKSFLEYAKGLLGNLV